MQPGPPAIGLSLCWNSLVVSIISPCLYDHMLITPRLAYVPDNLVATMTA